MHIRETPTHYCDLCGPSWLIPTYHSSPISSTLQFPRLSHCLSCMGLLFSLRGIYFPHNLKNCLVNSSFFQSLFTSFLSEASLRNVHPLVLSEHSGAFVELYVDCAIEPRVPNTWWTLNTHLCKEEREGWRKKVERMNKQGERSKTSITAIESIAANKKH